MNVLVTGIDGFVGRHLTNALLENTAHRIFGTVHKPTAPAYVVPLSPSVTPIDTNISDLRSVEKAIYDSRPIKLFHLAGQAFVPRSVEDPLTTFHTNINGTLNILEAVRKYTNDTGAKCSVLIVCSGEVYGDVTEEMLPVDEEAPLRPSNPYAVSKACADMLGRQYRTTFGVDAIVARPFNHLGPGQSELFVGSAFAKQVIEIKLGLRKPILLVGNLEPERDFTDARDVVQAYARLLEQPRTHPVYNICTGKSISVKKLLDLMIEQCGIRPEIIRDPSKIRKQEIPKIVGNSSRLKDETGWAPTIPITQTVRDLLTYWEQTLSRQK